MCAKMPHKDLKERKRYYKEYNQSERGRQVRRKYNQSDKGKKSHQKDTATYHKTEKGKITLKKYRQSEKGKQTFKRYMQSEKGKMQDAKHQAKRKRNLEFNVIISNPYVDTNIEFDWHHIDDNDVVAVPRNIHRSMYGNEHREQVNKWIEIHYDIEIKK